MESLQCFCYALIIEQSCATRDLVYSYWSCHLLSRVSGETSAVTVNLGCSCSAPCTSALHRLLQGSYNLPLNILRTPRLLLQPQSSKAFTQMCNSKPGSSPTEVRAVTRALKLSVCVSAFLNQRHGCLTSELAAGSNSSQENGIHISVQNFTIWSALS